MAAMLVHELEVPCSFTVSCPRDANRRQSYTPLFSENTGVHLHQNTRTSKHFLTQN